MSVWHGGFEGGLARGLPAASIEKFKQWLQVQPRYHGLRRIALHNSGAPNQHQTDITPGGYDQRQKNLVPHYKGKPNYWSGGPAFNIYPDGSIRGGTPWGIYGVHSPSWNDDGLGFEMMADFRPGVDDDDAGRGLVQKNVACEMIAAVLKHHGLPVNTDTVKLHREDPRTTHRCPGDDVEKPDVMRRVHDYFDALGTPGEHTPADEALVVAVEPDPTPASPPAAAKTYAVIVNDLNLRDRGGMNGTIMSKLAKDQKVRVWSVSSNASTSWAHITGTKDGKNYFDGYVAAAYLQEQSEAAKPLPVLVVIPTPSDNPHWAKQILTSSGLADFRAAGVIGNWQVESYPDLRPWVTGDKIDGVYTAFGVAQVRGPRKLALDTYGLSRGKPWTDFETQVMYLLQEIMSGLERPSGALLLKAKTVEEATAAYVSAERPRGWHWPDDRTSMADVLVAATKVSHWDWRLKHAQELLAK